MTAPTTDQHVNSKSLVPFGGMRPLWIMAAVWGIALAAGFGCLVRYSQQEGDRGVPPLTWPESHNLSAPVDRAKLLLFAHPHCPCTRASIRQLERVLTASRQKLDFDVILIGNSSVAADWRETPIAIAASALDRANVRFDGGELARVFHVRTSGHILLYDSRGVLKFSGGVNSFRGHEGDSQGAGSLVALLRNTSEDLATSPVFGCPLQNESDACGVVACESKCVGR